MYDTCDAAAEASLPWKAASRCVTYFVNDMRDTCDILYRVTLNAVVTKRLCACNCTAVLVLRVFVHPTLFILSGHQSTPQGVWYHLILNAVVKNRGFGRTLICIYMYTATPVLCVCCSSRLFRLDASLHISVMYVTLMWACCLGFGVTQGGGEVDTAQDFFFVVLIHLLNTATYCCCA